MRWGAGVVLNLETRIARWESCGERFLRNRLDHEHATRRFYELVWPHRASVLRLAQILTGNAAEADDLAQETFIKAFKALGQFRDGTDMLAWLATILRHTRIDRLRAGAASARNISLEQLAMEVADSGPEPEEAWGNPHEVLNAFGDREIIKALQELPEEIRWTLLLVDVQGMDQKEAAGILDIPVGTVKSRIHRGRAMLRQVLAPRAKEMRLVEISPRPRVESSGS